MMKNLTAAAAASISSFFQCHPPNNNNNSTLFLRYRCRQRLSQCILSRTHLHHHIFFLLLSSLHPSPTNTTNRSSSSSSSSSSFSEMPKPKRMILHDDDAASASSLEIGVGSARRGNGNETLTLDRIDLDHTTVRETISTSYGNDWKRALEFFNWVEVEEKDSQFHHDIHTYNTMIDILGKFFEFDLAWDLIHRMNNSSSSTSSFTGSCSSASGDCRFFSSPSRPDHTTFRIMFKRYVSAHMVREAIDTFNNRLEKFNLKDFTSFSNLIDALCEYKHVIEAEELLSLSSCMGMMNKKKDSMPHFAAGGIFNNPNTTKLYNMILRGWSRMGWWSKCREFWEEMDRKGVVRDIHSYTIYMDILCKSRKPWKAVKLYKELKKNMNTKGEIQLDVVAYNTVVHAVGLSDGVDESIRVYREMLEMGCKPNIVTYNTIIKLLCQSGRVKQAYSLFDQMPEKGCAPNVITYHCFFGCLNSPREILKLFEMMIESGVRPRMETFVMLIRKFGRWGFLRPVFVVWKKMEELGCSPDEFAYNALIDALIQKGMIDMALKYDNEMLERGLSAKPRKELGMTRLLNVEE